MEPSDEAILRVSYTQPALVLGGSIPSAIPPDLLISGSNDFALLQGDIVKILASIFIPPLCPSVLSSKYRVAVLLHGLSGCGKRTVIRHVARRLGMVVVEYTCHNLMSSSERKTSVSLAQAFNTAQSFSTIKRGQIQVKGKIDFADFPGHLFQQYTCSALGLVEDVNTYTVLMQSVKEIHRQQVLFVAAANSSEGLPPTIRRCFSHEISMGPLTEERRVEILSQLLQGNPELLSNTCSEEFIKDIVGQTSGFMPRDLRALVADAGVNLLQKSNFLTEKADIGNQMVLLKSNQCRTISHLMLNLRVWGKKIYSSHWID